MKILFPLNPRMRKLPEPLFEEEFDAAKSLNFECLLFDEDALIAGDCEAALQGIKSGSDGVLYRGWILTEERYRVFERALGERGYRMIGTSAEYAQVSYFPNYYPKIKDFSPPAVWTEAADPFAAWSASRKLGDGPFVIKDHIKSAKHRWNDACFIPKGASREQFETIAKNLFEEQGNSFFRGFVIKEYVPLKRVGTELHEYPRCEEYRLFFWRRRLLAVTHYHRKSEQPFDIEPFIGVANRFDAPFFSMDIACDQAGRWWIVDMGAGQVSSLPPNLKPLEFYRRLQSELSMEKAPTH